MESIMSWDYITPNKEDLAICAKVEKDFSKSEKEKYAYEIIQGINKILENQFSFMCIGTNKDYVLIDDALRKEANNLLLSSVKNLEWLDCEYLLKVLLNYKWYVFSYIKLAGVSYNDIEKDYKLIYERLSILAERLNLTMQKLK